MPSQPAQARIAAWHELIRTAANESEHDKVRRVNEFFNRLRYVSDLEHWGRNDYWATPLELLTSNAGDCEDFSIAKYHTLRQLGIANSKLKMVFVVTTPEQRPHMVLAYYPMPNTDPLILDSFVDEIRLRSQRSDLLPVYSFNADGLWLTRAQGKDIRVGSARQIGPWRDVSIRIERQRNI